LHCTTLYRKPLHIFNRINSGPEIKSPSPISAPISAAILQSAPEIPASDPAPRLHGPCTSSCSPAPLHHPARRRDLLPPAPGRSPAALAPRRPPAPSSSEPRRPPSPSSSSGRRPQRLASRSSSHLHLTPLGTASPRRRLPPLPAAPSRSLDGRRLTTIASPTSHLRRA
jgi:hypothetical protein